jgi:hypothetical protein
VSDVSINIGADRFDLKVTKIGPIASRVIQNGATSRVAAVFDSSFYIDVADGLVCVCADGLPIGPLNLITNAPPTTSWAASGVRVGARAHVTQGSLLVGERFRFDLAGAPTWTPIASVETWTTETVEQGLMGFREACDGHIPDAGLGGFIRGIEVAGEGAGMRARTWISIKALDAWITASIADPDQAAPPAPGTLAPLLGLGPGLTPSGDDLIGGAMVAAHVLGEVGVCRHLWSAAGPIVVAAGNPIAVAHLTAASQGLASDGIHRALDGITQGWRPSRDVLAGIDAIGHTSGWDAMAGVTLLVEAWIRSREISL